ncbi:hypothetical protein J1605_005046 [Eschrichtius robustus]|uniref:Uncharacterized protein n=1 Tax=Eschrichtius robustus TaxID=9764 RepID=A0AB34HCY8_ESCRO|nr:hypothetical protein J1605_005046 [Eschrichtius robustus]
MYRALSPMLFIYCNSAKLCLLQATADVDEILVMCRGKRVQAPSCVTDPDPGDGTLELSRRYAVVRILKINAIGFWKRNSGAGWLLALKRLPMNPTPVLSSLCKILPPKGASLVAQWLRICLPMQGTRVRALVWEDPTCRGATRPVSHNY